MKRRSSPCFPVVDPVPACFVLLGDEKISWDPDLDLRLPTPPPGPPPPLFALLWTEKNMAYGFGPAPIPPHPGRQSFCWGRFVASLPIGFRYKWHLGVV
jgi:hypothetical protein